MISPTPTTFATEADRRSTRGQWWSSGDTLLLRFLADGWRHFASKVNAGRETLHCSAAIGGKPQRLDVPIARRAYTSERATIMAFSTLEKPFPPLTDGLEEVDDGR
jgi:hypothetical protein